MICRSKSETYFEFRILKFQLCAHHPARRLLITHADD
jgi:hypothetical protein